MKVLTRINETLLTFFFYSVCKCYSSSSWITKQASKCQTITAAYQKQSFTRCMTICKLEHQPCYEISFNTKTKECLLCDANDSSIYEDNVDWTTMTSLETLKLPQKTKQVPLDEPKTTESTENAIDTSTEVQQQTTMLTTTHTPLTTEANTNNDNAYIQTVLGNSLTFPKENKNELFAVPNIQPLTSFSVCFWMVATDLKDPKSIATFVSPLPDKDSCSFFEIYIKQSTMRINYEENDVNTDLEIKTNVLYDICVITYPEMKKFYLYVNGTSVDDQAYVVLDDQTIPSLFAIAKKYQLKGGNCDTVENRRFDGVLADVNVWDIPLSDEEVKDIHDGVKPQTKPFIKWESFLKIQSDIEAGDVK